ncbi:TPA: hypothetical protein ACX6QA_003456 [Photobacterium damselae]
MKFSRQSLKDNERKIKNVDEFVEGADVNNPSDNKVGRPKSTKELTKPVSVSLTETDKKMLDNQVMRFNTLSYQLDYDKSLNRSDIVRIVTHKLTSMSDEDFIRFLK